MKGWVTQLRKGLIEYCVMNLLNGSENYGYEIVVQLKALEVMGVSHVGALEDLFPVRRVAG